MWSPSITNNMERNWKSATIGTLMATFVVEPVNHYWGSLKTLNLVYEWPKNTSQWSIFIKEAFKTPYFWSELRKKYFFLN